MTSIPSRQNISTAATVIATPARRVTHRNVAVVGGVPSAAPGAAVHPAMFASMNGNSSTHSTRVRLRDVRPPQAYASITGPGRSAAAPDRR